MAVQQLTVVEVVVRTVIDAETRTVIKQTSPPLLVIFKVNVA